MVWEGNLDPPLQTVVVLDLVVVTLVAEEPLVTIKKSKFEIGQRVGCGLDERENFTLKLRYEGEYGDGPVFGKVVDISKNGKVKVLWDDDWLNEHDSVFSKSTGELEKDITIPCTISASLLLSEKEIKAKFSKLEKEYEVIAKQVRIKLAEAGKIIKEANKLAKKAGAESLADMHDSVGPLESAMDMSGWRSSSWSC